MGVHTESVVYERCIFGILSLYCYMQQRVALHARTQNSGDALRWLLYFLKALNNLISKFCGYGHVHNLGLLSSID